MRHLFYAILHVQMASNILLQVSFVNYLPSLVSVV